VANACPLCGSMNLQKHLTEDTSVYDGLDCVMLGCAIRPSEPHYHIDCENCEWGESRSQDDDLRPALDAVREARRRGEA
jgi:hypothetical protein